MNDKAIILSKQTHSNNVSIELGLTWLHGKISRARARAWPGLDFESSGSKLKARSNSSSAVKLLDIFATDV